MSATVKNTAKQTELLPAVEENGEILDELLEREGRIERAQRNAYYEIGLDLKAIKHKTPTPLYKADRPEPVAGRYTFETWEEYLDGRWEWTVRHVDRIIEWADAVDKIRHKCPVLPVRGTHVTPLLRIESDEDRAAVWQQVVDSGETVTAKRVEEAVERFVAAKDKSWLTVEEWNALSEDDQNAAINMPSKSTLNKQDGDSIEWAQWTWNPVTGCKHDCPYCYARDIANRFNPQKFEPSIYPGRLEAPANATVPDVAKTDVSYKNVFTCSMADLFGRWVPEEWINLVLDTISDNKQWNFLMLTKFPKRMAEFKIPSNAWMGTTIDCQSRVAAAEKAFENVGGKVKWVSIEPMLTPLKFKKLDLFQWVVVGGSSVSSQTPKWVPPFDWVVDLHNQARAAKCAIYHKANLGLTEDMRLKEFPWVKPIKKDLPSDLRYSVIK